MAACFFVDKAAQIQKCSVTFRNKNNYNWHGNCYLNKWLINWHIPKNNKARYVQINMRRKKNEKTIG
jgi:hypothetical protein